MSDLIPVSRKEQYLSKIDGMTKKSPDKTYTKEEYFFSEILGEAMHKPILETRYEIYLAKIAGREIGIPYPETRLERFLAKAAGMDISVPTPITREEMYWLTYSPFYLSNASGEPPLSYNSVTGTLNNYRIYGQTSRNLFSSRIEQGSFDASTGALDGSRYRVRSHADDYIYLLPGKYELSASGVDYSVIYGYDSPDVNTFNSNLSRASWVNLPSTITINTSAYYKFGFRRANNQAITPSDISNIMLNSGSTPLPYEPYGKSVGDRTGNLFDKNSTNINNGFIDSKFLDNAGLPQSDDFWIVSEYITVKPNTVYTYSNAYIGATPSLCEYDNNDTLIQANQYLGGKTFTFTTNATTKKIRLSIRKDHATDAMLNTGSTPLPYEPYGYKVPVTVSNGTDTLTIPIYLPEPIKMVGDEAEYIDYGEQKMHRIGADDLDVTLPALPTVTGTNVLSIGTEVQPSHVFVEFYKEREYG